ncbi:type IV secretion system protein (plasmid) [Bradyrhizobium sp. 183]|uniref:type IV secretion system protein n=1 Tax=unclassified Bradyrhizobium TaxID=2631580 RepID=UPI001FFF5742|nr:MULTISPECIES: type IV secretion system protein [unclassified Bradyrhizobium]UPJ84959.1 type IV secretion system protein [Bradyrhizobium sp. 184]UPJ92745.1 type IV secretion system protein [Bradyrhizobium sp. 183]
MGLISSMAHDIDTTFVDYAQTVFHAVADPIRALLGTIALIALLFIALNHVVQFTSVNYSTYLQWGLRYVLIYSFATMWDNFKGIYLIVTEVPSDYGALMVRGVVATLKTNAVRNLNAANIVDTYSAMDESARAVLQIAHDSFSHLSAFKVGKAVRGVFFGAFSLIVGGFFIAACVIIVVVGKLGLAVAVGLAPLAITMLMMPQTKPHFESWTRFTVGYSVIPLLTTALMTMVLHIALGTRAASSDPFVFVFIMMAATILLFQIPTMASTLAGASVAAVGAGAAVAAASIAKREMMSLYVNAQGLRDTVTAAGARVSPAKAASPANNAMRQSACMRQRRWDERVARRTAEQLST